MPEFPLLSSGFGAAAFLALSIFIGSGPSISAPARWLLGASVISATWLACQMVFWGHFPDALELDILRIVEISRTLCWLGFLNSMLGEASARTELQRVRRRMTWVTATFCLIALVALAARMLPATDAYGDLLRKIGNFSALALAVVGLWLIEQLFRNADAERRWAIKYFCLSVGAMFVFDFALYADGVLFGRVDPALWTGRGAANGLAVPLLAVAARRNREWKPNLYLSRTFVFHGTALLGVGLYLLAMSGVGYYLRIFGGNWGNALRAVFLFAGLVLLVSIVGSAGVRARLRLFLSKHFYRDKFDYGEVWLSFTQRLSQGDSRPEVLNDTILRAIADIMEATGGALWLKSVTGDYRVAATWALEVQRLREISGEHALISTLAGTSGVIDVQAEAERVTLDSDARVPNWLLELPRAWLLIPIVHREELLAIVLLCESRTGQSLTWEDQTLLGTLGRQAAGYLALMQATEELGTARQFEAFNRLSAFLVHDLKNVVAQLSLVIRNSERHRDNPEFISDAFNTIGDAVSKMNRMLANLRHTQSGPSETLQVDACAREALSMVSQRAPRPVVENEVPGQHIVGNRDRFMAALEHLLQNAQEATGPNGHVTLRIARSGSQVSIEIRDDGCGMSREFIQNRLFRPFDTTKGKAGMGIGVYESLHVINGMGGRLEVDSCVGAGTTFLILLPAADVESAPVAAQFREKTA